MKVLSYFVSNAIELRFEDAKFGYAIGGEGESIFAMVFCGRAGSFEA